MTQGNAAAVSIYKHQSKNYPYEKYRISAGYIYPGPIRCWCLLSLGVSHNYEAYTAEVICIP